MLFHRRHHSGINAVSRAIFMWPFSNAYISDAFGACLYSQWLVEFCRILLQVDCCIALALHSSVWCDYFWLLESNGSSTARVAKPLCRSASAGALLTCYLEGQWPRLSSISGACSCNTGAASKTHYTQPAKVGVTSSFTTLSGAVKVCARVTNGIKAQEMCGGGSSQEHSSQVHL
jgi:hypothetical protein